MKECTEDVIHLNKYDKRSTLFSLEVRKGTGPEDIFEEAIKEREMSSY